jgi:hypothetical protein
MPVALSISKFSDTHDTAIQAGQSGEIPDGRDELCFCDFSLPEEIEFNVSFLTTKLLLFWGVRQLDYQQLALFSCPYR